MSGLKRVHSLALVAACLGALVASVAAQQPAAPPPITMKQLKPDVWVGLGGAGGTALPDILGRIGASPSVAAAVPRRGKGGGPALVTQLTDVAPKKAEAEDANPKDASKAKKAPAKITATLIAMRGFKIMDGLLRLVKRCALPNPGLERKPRLRES